MLCIQNTVRDAFLDQHAGKEFGHFNGNGTHQDRLSLGVQFLDSFNNGMQLFPLGPEDQIGIVLTDHGTVGWDSGNFQIIDLGKFHSLSICSTRHA